MAYQLLVAGENVEYVLLLAERDERWCGCQPQSPTEAAPRVLSGRAGGERRGGLIAVLLPEALSTATSSPPAAVFTLALPLLLLLRPTMFPHFPLSLPASSYTRRHVPNFSLPGVAIGGGHVFFSRAPADVFLGASPPHFSDHAPQMLARPPRRRLAPKLQKWLRRLP